MRRGKLTIATDDEYTSFDPLGREGFLSPKLMSSLRNFKVGTEIAVRKNLLKKARSGNTEALETLKKKYGLINISKGGK